MTNSSVTRRTFIAVAAAAGTTPYLRADPDTAETIASRFLTAWDEAWGQHDAHALAALHTTDAVTVNRFGTLIAGRTPTEKALDFLHSKEGPFGHSTFPTLKLMKARRVAADVVIVQAGWKNPVMHADGRISETEWNDMIVTYVLVRDGQAWRVSEIDPHNVEKMDLPYSNPGQKP